MNSKGNHLFTPRYLTEVNVYHFCRLFIDEDILRVTIAQAQDVAHHRCSCHTVNIGQTPLEPYARYGKLFQQEIMKHWLYMFTDFRVDFLAHPRGLSQSSLKINC